MRNILYCLGCFLTGAALGFLNLLLIPYIGPWGAFAVTAVGSAIGFGVYMNILEKKQVDLLKQFNLSPSV